MREAKEPNAAAAAPVAWSARQYLTFEGERTRPVRDLLAALPSTRAGSPGPAVRSAIDLGCGPGNSTELLAARFPGAAVTGLDSSADMLAAARTRLPDVTFEQLKIEQWVYAPNIPAYDVILANAVLHWVPDHERLFAALTARLAQGGVLAAQMPDNLEQPSHRAMREIAADGPWRHRLSAVMGVNGSPLDRTPVAAAGWYDELLRALGCRPEIWRTTYYHRLAGGAAAVVEWFKGSGLRPFLAPLDTGERVEFLRRYEHALAEALPAASDGSVLLPFPRLFLIAAR